MSNKIIIFIFLIIGIVVSSEGKKLTAAQQSQLDDLNTKALDVPAMVSEEAPKKLTSYELEQKIQQLLDENSGPMNSTGHENYDKIQVENQKRKIKSLVRSNTARNNFQQAIEQNQLKIDVAKLEHAKLIKFLDSHQSKCNSGRMSVQYDEDTYNKMKDLKASDVSKSFLKHLSLKEEALLRKEQTIERMLEKRKTSDYYLINLASLSGETSTFDCPADENESTSLVRLEFSGSDQNGLTGVNVVSTKLPSQDYSSTSCMAGFKGEKNFGEVNDPGFLHKVRVLQSEDHKVRKLEFHDTAGMVKANDSIGGEEGKWWETILQSEGCRLVRLKGTRFKSDHGQKIKTLIATCEYFTY